MWHPLNKNYTTETFNNSKTGDYTYSDFLAQNAIGGVVSLRNIATGLLVTTLPGAPWPSIGFDTNINFSQSYPSITGQFFQSGSTPLTNAAYGTIGFKGVSNIYFTGDFSLNTGFLVEGSFLITNLTGVVSTGINQYGVLINRSGEGYDSITLSLNPPGFIVGKGLAHETYIPATGIDSYIVGFRYGCRNSTGHFITTDGISTIITGRTLGSDLRLTGFGYTGAPAQLIVGDITLTGNQISTSRVDSSTIKFKYPINDILGDFIDDVIYHASETFETAIFRPRYKIKQWGAIYANLIGNTGGTTSLSVSYSNDNGTSFDDTLTTDIISSSNTGLFSGILTGIVYNNLVGNYNPSAQAIKVAITQETVGDRSVPPPAVDYITITFEVDNSNGLVSANPDHGPADGEVPILISIDRDKKEIRNYTKKEAVFLVNLTGNTSYRDVAGKTFGSSSRFNQGHTGVFGLPSHDFMTYQRCTGVTITGQFGLEGLFYKTPDLYPSYLPGQNGILTTDPFTILYPTGTLTGLPTGYIGNTLKPVTFTGATTGTPVYSTSFILYPETGIGSPLSNWAAQSYDGYPGGGFTSTGALSVLPATSGLLYEAIIQVDEGGVYFGPLDYTGSGAFYTKNRFKQPQRVFSVFNTGINHTLAILATDQYGSITGTSQSKFTIAGIRCHGFADSQISFTGTLASNVATLTGSMDSDWCLDTWIQPKGFSQQTGNFLHSDYLVCMTGSAFNLSFSLSKDGLPCMEYSGVNGPDYATGLFGLELSRWNHLAFNHTGTTTECYINGELSFSYQHTGSIAPNPNKMFVGRNYAGLMSTLRIRSGAYSPQYIGFNDAFAVKPKFQSYNQFNTGSSKFLYRMDEGTLSDYSTNKNHLIVPEVNYNRDTVIRDSVGVFGEGIAFLDKGYAVSITGRTHINSGMYMAGYMAWNNVYPDTISTIASGSNWHVYMETGKFHFKYNGSKFVSTDQFVSFEYFPFVIDLLATGTYGNVVGYCLTGTSTSVTQMFSGNITTTGAFDLSGCLSIGHMSGNTGDRGNIYLDELGLWTGRYTGQTGFLRWDDIKDYPIEYVYFNDSAISTGRVRHIGVYDKEIILPPLTSITATGMMVNIKVDSLYGQLEVFPLFQYSAPRKIVLDTGSYQLWAETRDKICKTKSPFRIGTRVPENGVNLAYINTQEFSIGSNLSIVENVGNITDNYVSSMATYDVLSCFTGTIATGINKFIYTGEIDTDNILITTYQTIRPDISKNMPLFYKYKLGGELFYNYLPEFTGVVTELLRKVIKITDQDGIEVSVEEFPWDVRASSVRSDGFALPPYIYNVEILTTDRFIPGRSLFVEYNAADSSNEFTQIKGWRECLNPEPIFAHTNSDIDEEETFVTINNKMFTPISGGLNQGPILIVNQLTGLWNARVGRNIYHRNEFIF